MNKIITTTTNTLEGWTISEYYEPITANVVVGSNVFSDFAAGWTDFFGGRSNTYERKLQEIYKQAIETLSERARRVGANCIVGLRIDIDEISGKGTQMFMITALGTPVSASKQGEKFNLKTGNSIDGNLVEKKVKARQIIQRLQGQENAIYWIKQEEIDCITESQLMDYMDFVLWLYEKFGSDTGEGLDNVFQDLSRYFGRIDRELASNAIYGKLLKEDLPGKSRNRLIHILRTYGMINYEKIGQIIRSPDFSIAKKSLKLIEDDKNYYSEEDKAYLQTLKNTIRERFTPIVEITTKKKMLSSSEKEVWICGCGKTNNKETAYCELCSTDIYGFKRYEMHAFDIIELIDNRLAVLEELKCEALSN